MAGNHGLEISFGSLLSRDYMLISVNGTDE